MNHNLTAHFKQWFAVSREQLNGIRSLYEEQPVEVSLQQLQAQYGRLSNIRKVCQGKAYFVGVPRSSK